MENFNPKKENENVAFTRHGHFFSGPTARNITGKSLIVMGSAVLLVAIYEGLTGEKAGHLIHKYIQQLPNTINWVIDHLDMIPYARKALVASALSSMGVILHRSVKRSRNK